MNTNPGIPPAGIALGAAGVLPFVGAAGAMFASDPVVSGVGLYVLSVYAAVVLAFVGAVHFGVAIARDHPQAHWQLALSALPALLAWLALVTLSPARALIAFGFLFLAMLLADGFALRLDLLPRWYTRLRIPLTVIVCGALWTAAWQLGR